MNALINEVVDDFSGLLPFQVPEFSCDLTDDEFKARCVTIPYAKDAGKVWLGFSDTAWTWDVLQAHRKQAVRDQHMQMVDVQAWVAGNTQQADTLPFNQLTQAVNEFVEIPSAPRPKLVQTVTESVSVLQSPSEKRGPTGENVIELPTITVTAYAEHPSFSYSPHEYFGTSSMTERFAAWGEQETEKGVPPMIAMVADPVAITTDLAALAQLRYDEFLSRDDIRRPYANYVIISQLEESIRNSAELALIDEARRTAKQSAIQATAYQGWRLFLSYGQIWCTELSSVSC